jgi:hypothetical protein
MISAAGALKSPSTIFSLKRQFPARQLMFVLCLPSTGRQNPRVFMSNLPLFISSWLRHGHAMQRDGGVDCPIALCLHSILKQSSSAGKARRVEWLCAMRQAARQAF